MEFDVQTNRQTLARRLDVEINEIKKEKLTHSGYYIWTNHWVKNKESKKRNMFLDLARELRKLWGMWVTVMQIVIGAHGTVSKGLEKNDKRTNRDHPDYRIVETGQKSKKSPGELRRLAVTQTPVKDHKLTPAWKTCKEDNNNNNNNDNYNNNNNIYIYFDLARELKIMAEHESGDNINCNLLAWHGDQRIRTVLGNKRKSGDHLNYCIVEISQNTKKILGTWGHLLSPRLQLKTIS